MCFCDCLLSAAGGAGAGCPRCDAYQASLESGNPLVPVRLRLSSRPAALARRGPGRGARGPFANQKNRRAQNDLGRRPSTPQKRGAVDQGHSAATERTQALDDEPRRPAQTRCSAARRSFKGQFDSQPALCANVLDEFVRALLPRSTSRRAGRPVGSTPLRVRTAFFKAVMFPLHLISPSRVSFPLSPQRS